MSGEAPMAEQPRAQARGEGGEWRNYETVFTNEKAGMGGVDKERVKRVVFEMSKNSAHFKNEQRKQAKVEERIGRLKVQAQKLTPQELAAQLRLMDQRIADLEASRDLSRTWLHVDMDAFFASVEERDRPELKSQPMAVGGKSMISTANYEARKYGVRSAMPGFIALRLCPNLVFVKTDFNKYKQASEETRAIFKCFDPDFDAGSLDEAYLDVTEYSNKSGLSGAQVAAILRDRVREVTQLTCSVGVAPNRFLAKVASDMNKPNGQYVVESERHAVKTFVDALPIRKVPGIGKVTEQTLHAFSIHTCHDLMENRALISALFSPSSCSFFLDTALGLGSNKHWEVPGPGEAGRKGISCERTFKALSTQADLEHKARELAAHLAADMAKEGLKGKTVTLKLKTTAFEVRTRATTLPCFVSSANEILKPVLKALAAEMPIEVRLMGIRVSSFYEERVTRGQCAITTFVKPGKQCLSQRDASQATPEKQEEFEDGCQGDAKDQTVGQADSNPSVQTFKRARLGGEVGSVNPVECARDSIPCQQVAHAGSHDGSGAVLIDADLTHSGCQGQKDRGGCALGTPQNRPWSPAAGAVQECSLQSSLPVSFSSCTQTKCSRCGAWVSAAEQQEHEDYHLALDLQAETPVAVRPTAPQRLAPGGRWSKKRKSGGRCSKSRRSSESISTTLDAFLQKR